MPAAHGRSSSVFLNAYNVSAFLSSFDSTQTVDTAEVTTFGSTSKSYVTGLRDGTITLGGYYDGGAAALDEIMSGILSDTQVSYGTDLITINGAVSDYDFTQNVVDGTPLSGFSQTISFGDNSALRFALKLFNKTAGKNYLVSFFVQMTDGQAPNPGTNTSGDFTALFNNVAATASTPRSATLITGSIYLITYRFTSTQTHNIQDGVAKYTTNNNRSFRMAGYAVNEITTTAATNPVLSICEDGALTIGNRCLVANVIDTSYQITGSISEAVSISAEFQANGEGASGAYRGIVLAPLAVYSNGQNTTASDNSAATSNGLVANLHVLNAGGSTTVKVQHSTDNSTWTDLITFTTGAIQFCEHKVSTGTVHRYLRVNVTTDGLAQMLVTVARK